MDIKGPVFSLILIALGLLGMGLKIEYSGWVLFVGLFVAFNIYNNTPDDKDDE